MTKNTDKNKAKSVDDKQDKSAKNIADQKNDKSGKISKNFSS